jgi:hypothetical protein
MQRIQLRMLFPLLLRRSSLSSSEVSDAAQSGIIGEENHMKLAGAWALLLPLLVCR